MKKTLTTSLLAILVCACMALGFTACGNKCKHTYDNACDAICNECEETRTITHDWKDADCDTPKTCKICGNTEGEELGHDWKEADCDTPKTCKICGATEGDEVGHMAEYDDGDCTTELICTCGYIIAPARSHEPEDDDGDCYTALMCKNCIQFVRAGQSEHSKTDIDENWKCDNPGCEQEILVMLNGVVFKLNDDKESCYVSGFVGIDGTEINIPATCNGLPVIAIGDSAFFNREQFTSVTFDEDSKVEKIGVNAFANCNALESITIPDSVTAIDEAALSECPVLKSVTFGEDSKLKTIGNQAFAGCTALQNITIPNSVTTIGEGAFKYCPVLESITIPSSVTAISDMAFSECYRLKSVTLPDTVTTIGEHAFSSTLVESIFIPASVEKVGYYSFYDCPALKTVIFGENSKLATVGYSAFIACGSLTSVYYGGSRADWEKIEIDELAIPSFAIIYTYSADIPTIKGNYWRYENGVPTAWKEVALGGVVYQLNNDCESYTVTGLASDFAGTEVIIPATVNDKPVTAIGEWAFSGYINVACKSLTDVEIPSSVTEIGDRAFTGCSTLESVTFGENSQLKTIGKEAFYGTALASVTIPASVTEIGEGAFWRCKELTSVYYEGTEADWGDVDKITIGDDAISTNATVYYYLKNVPDTTVNYWSYVDGVPTALKFIATEQIIFELNEDKESYSVKGLKDGFEGEILIIPATYEGKPVTAIGEEAFDCSINSAYLNLISVTIPASVETIDKYAFYGFGIGGYSKLMSVFFEEDSNIQTIGKNAFASCINLTSVNFGANSKLQTIGNYAFFDCIKLTSVIIPDSVTEIGKYAFSGCTALTSVYYGETEADWGDVDKITIGSNAIPTNAIVYYYSENKPEGEGNYWHYDANGVPTTEWDD